MRKTTLMAGMAMVFLLTSLSVRANAQKLNLDDINLEKLGKEALVTVGVGAGVNAAAKPLNDFINTITLRRGVKDTQTTKVVPMLSVGDKGYVGAAQISGPASIVGKVKAVWQVEGSKKIGDNLYRIKVLVPSDSLSPLSVTRVQKVGVSAVIDIATGGPLSKEGPYSRGVRGVDLVKAGAIIAVVNAASKPLSDYIASLTGTKNTSITKIVPLVTLGEKAYVGAIQTSGSSLTVPKVKGVWQYEDLFDRGRYRVKILIPVDDLNPLKLRRVAGVGMTALIDTTIQSQRDQLTDKKDVSRPVRPGQNPRPSRPTVPQRIDNGGVDIGRLPPGIAKKIGLDKHDNGKHKGWDKEKHKGKKDKHRD